MSDARQPASGHGSVAAASGRREHDFDPETWKCRRCTVRATSGIVICLPHPDIDANDGGSDAAK